LINGFGVKGRSRCWAPSSSHPSRTSYHRLLTPISRRRSRTPRLKSRPTSGPNPRDLYQRPPAQRRGFFYARHPGRRPRAPGIGSRPRRPARRPRAPGIGSRPAAPGPPSDVPAPAPGPAPGRSRLPAPGSRLPAPARLPLPAPAPGSRSRGTARVPRLSGQNPGNPRLAARSARHGPGRRGTRARAMFFTNNHQKFDMTSRGGILMLNVPYVSRETMI
jgi:hypothetical protein